MIDVPTPVRAARVVAASALLCLVALACQEDLTAPGSCPALCPGGAPEVVDTVLTPVPGGDSTFIGYIEAGAGSALLAAEQLGGVDARAVLRFASRGDSVLVRDTLRAFTVDSVLISVGLLARDSTVSGLSLVLYRLPSTVDSSVTLADVNAAFIPANLVGTIPIPDSIQTGSVQLPLADTLLARVAIPPGDSGILAIAIGLQGPAQTGVRLGSQTGGSLAPAFTTFVTADIADTALQAQSIVRVASFNTFVTSTAGFPPPDLLSVGGAPSSRSLIRFALPSRIKDSVQILRATLEFVPESPLPGLPNDPATLEVRGILSDIGAKSPLCNLSNLCGGAIITRRSQAELVTGSTDTLRVEVPDIVRGWQGEDGAPEAFFVLLIPEGGSFTTATFGSTRAGVHVPRLRITYARRLEFEVP
ncbi:MAG TPA: hypothetical protein VK845_10245 [Gemmatimonadales bacterium]|nr:hypothetical protein [Gemmatimonadales bacterium]